MGVVSRGDEQEVLNRIYSHIGKVIWRGIYEKSKHDLCFDIQKWFQSSLPAGLLKECYIRKCSYSEDKSLYKTHITTFVQIGSNTIKDSQQITEVL